jgi:hypothetical protein
MIKAYPLQWPDGYGRTPRDKRISSNFKQSFDAAQRHLNAELLRMDAKNIVVSTNLRIRNDGFLYTDELNKKIDDSGVAVYFMHDGKKTSLCCDQYLKVWENIYALAKGVEALRGIARWGISDFINRAFTGFAAIPESNPVEKWWTVLNISENASIDEIKSSYRTMAKIHHPDMGGTDFQFNRINRAYGEALKEKK